MTKKQQDLAGLHFPIALNSLVAAVNQIELGNTEGSKVFLAKAKDHITTLQQALLKPLPPPTDKSN